MSNGESNINEIKKVLEEIKNGEKNIERLLETLSNSVEELKKRTKKIIESRIEMNNLIINRLLPIIAGATAVITMIFFLLSFFLGDKYKASIIFPFGILAIGGLAIIALVIALAIINKSED